MDNFQNRHLSLIRRSHGYPYLTLFALSKIEEIRKENRQYDTMDMVDMYLTGAFDILDFLNDIYIGNGGIKATENFPYDLVSPEHYE